MAQRIPHRWVRVDLRTIERLMVAMGSIYPQRLADVLNLPYSTAQKALRDLERQGAAMADTRVVDGKRLRVYRPIPLDVRERTRREEMEEERNWTPPKWVHPYARRAWKGAA